MLHMMYCVLSSVINQENNAKLRAGSFSFTSSPELSEMGRSINVYMIFVCHFSVGNLTTHIAIYIRYNIARLMRLQRRLKMTFLAEI